MPSKVAQSFIVLVVAAALGATGCAWLQSRQPMLEQAGEKTAQVVDHSLAVLTCASFMQRMAFDSGKRLPKEAALAFCAALEGSPDVAPPPAHPAPAAPETI